MLLAPEERSSLSGLLGWSRLLGRFGWPRLAVRTLEQFASETALVTFAHDDFSLKLEYSSTRRARPSPRILAYVQSAFDAELAFGVTSGMRADGIGTSARGTNSPRARIAADVRKSPVRVRLYRIPCPC